MEEKYPNAIDMTADSSPPATSDRRKKPTARYISPTVDRAINRPTSLLGFIINLFKKFLIHLA